MSNNITITATGNVVNEPIFFEKKKDKPAFVSFRLASTPGHFDQKAKEWVNGTTSWFTVNAHGSLAEHIVKSFRKGDPALVSGTLRTKLWKSEDGEKEGADNVIDARAAGHNLLWGSSEYTNTNVSASSVADALGDEPELEEIPLDD